MKNVIAAQHITKFKEPTGKLFLGRKLPVFLLVSLILFGLDLVTRTMCFASLCTTTVTRWLSFVPFRNYNFAFSLEVPTVLMYAIYTLVLGVVTKFVVTNWKRNSDWVNFGWCVVCTGAVANILDRVYFGYVRDFIKVGSSFFNLGDVWIVLGILILCVEAFKNDSHSEM
jgi:signal peptidase II